MSLCIEKTKLQGMGPQSMAESMRYMKMTSHVNIKGTKLDFADEVEHVGIIRSVHGNNANLLSRISSHKKAIGAVLHNGMARNHRGNPAASVSAEKLFGASVLFSGLGSLVLKNDEIDLLDHYYSRTLQNLMRLHPNTPRCVTLFLAGSLPGRALLHLRQFSLFSMLIQLDGKPLKQLVCKMLTYSKPNSNSWFHQLRNLCLQYNLPHPLELVESPPSKGSFKALVKKRVLQYWERKLHAEADPLNLPSLHYFHPQFLSLAKPHQLWLTAGASAYQVTMALVQARMLSGRYRTERLARFWSKNKSGCCLLPTCTGLKKSEDIEHILVHCGSLSTTRTGLILFTEKYGSDLPAVVKEILSTFCNLSHPNFVQFLLDCTVLPKVISAVQLHGECILNPLLRVTRSWCYSLHRERLKLLGRWTISR